MTAIPRFVRMVALAPFLAGAPLAGWAQGSADGADALQPLAAAATLPGTVVERNVFVPVDSSGHTGGEYIVVERRVVTKGAADAAAEVPTHFILVPQDGDDEEAASDDPNDDDEAPSQ
jgi:hypothetical protein